VVDEFDLMASATAAPAVGGRLEEYVDAGEVTFGPAGTVETAGRWSTM
jgi:hypothetical protein